MCEWHRASRQVDVLMMAVIEASAASGQTGLYGQVDCGQVSTWLCSMHKLLTQPRNIGNQRQNEDQYKDKVNQLKMTGYRHVSPRKYYRKTLKK